MSYEFETTFKLFLNNYLLFIIIICLKNYFKIAIAVLKRRKFFTFISLFGISFTLTILIVLTAFVDNVISPNYPEVNRDRSLYITDIHQRSSKKGYSMNGPASYYYMEKYVASLKTPSKVAISSSFVPVNTYVNNKKLSLSIKYTNEDFWEVIAVPVPGRQTI